MYEQQILLVYILFQRFTEFNQLDQKRFNYNNIERRIKRYAIRFFVFLGIFHVLFYLFLIYFHITGSVYGRLLTAFIGFAVFVTVISAFVNISFFFGVSLFIAMRQYQRYEFWRHWRRLLISQFVFLGCFLAISYLFVDMCFHFGKALANLKLGLDSSIELAWWNETYVALEEIVYNLPCTLYFVFLSMTTPHDCFACFNRLPNKRYSIY
jgi:hypothetical protein